MKNWYLLQSKMKRENTAQDNLIAQNYTVYSPKVKINQKTVSLFTRYLFVQLNKQTDNFSPINSAKDVADSVRFGLEFARMPDDIINNIKAQENKTINKIINLSKFHQDDKIKISNTTFETKMPFFPIMTVKNVLSC